MPWFSLVSKPDAAPSGVTPASDPVVTDSDHVILNALAGILEGDYSRIPPDDGEVFNALRALKAADDARTLKDLETVVAFSMGASEAMAAVSFVTGDVREVARNTQSIAAAVEEMTEKINQIRLASTIALNGTQDAESAVQSSRTSANRAIGAMNSLKELSEDADAKLRNLSEVIAAIGKILETIDAVSRQTNLLALNATIEAARAGEAGKGFAVVAGEVKQLANQTAKATEDIQRKIGSINEGMSDMRSAMEKTTLAVEAGRSDIHAVGTEIESVIRHTRTAADQISETAASVAGQAEAVREVSKNLTAITDMADRSKGYAEKAIAVVGNTEKNITNRLQRLQGKNIPNAALEIAKSDHNLWKKRLADMLVGKSILRPEELASHHHCRLGKWYDSTRDTRLTQHPAFIGLQSPHERVHEHGKKLTELFAEGDRSGAWEEYAKMEMASKEVLALLDELKRSAEGNPETAIKA